MENSDSNNSAPISRRRAIAGSAVGIGTLVLPTAAIAASPGDAGPAGQTTTTQTFSTSDSFIVPEGVTSLVIRAEGSAGGVSDPSSITADTNATQGVYNYVTLEFKNGMPGSGGDVSGTVSVTPGETLNIVLGSMATSPAYTAPNDGTASVSFRGGNGGIGIGIRRGSTWLLVAGGGGGSGIGGFNYNSGNGGYFTVTNNVGGNGGAAGASGSNGVTGSHSQFGGGGGTTSSAGSGGAGFATGPFNGNGSAGGAPTGTNLGVGGAVSGNGALRGGAGGSGYYGGGGGGSGSGDGSGAGGGGGSNYTDADRVSDVTTSTSTRSLADSALLTITYTV